MKKSDFIKDLSHKKSISIDDRDRLWALCAKEFDNVDKTLLDREKSLNIREKELDNAKKTLLDRNRKNKNTKETKHCPKDVAEFLSLFNAREGFKYLTHDYENPETPFNYQEFLEKVKKVFDYNAKKYTIPSTLYSLVRFYIFGKGLNQNTTYWTSYNNKKNEENWSCTKWIGWSIANDNMHPIRNPQFAEIIGNFRATTRIVAPALKDIINNIIKKIDKENKFKFEYKDLEKADFYTNVVYLQKIVEKILRTIITRPDFPKITISYKRETKDDFLIRKIIISQIDSKPSNPLDEAMKKLKEDKGGDFYEIIQLMRGYCNWYVETLWDGKPIRWNILDDTGAKEIENIPEEKVVDFTHILTFYQK